MNFVLAELVKMNGGSEFRWATDVDERNHLWKARHEILWACMALKPGSKVWDISDWRTDEYCIILYHFINTYILMAYDYETWYLYCK
ncbi:hypothetical protein DPMN_171057 [Dreissena polymorpha]|uniref:Uncharacterized protein n=1 Tax=Dreissena polymorpha TaxID=45954 RepID=A0A9D4DZN0_DREPO|nr:hypothetical protein DPMN_171057 [Dreissena polymorpha]